VQRLGAHLLTIGFVLLIPVLLPFGLALAVLHRHRIRSVARRFPCTGCGRMLGPEAVRVADAEWDRRMRELRAQHPNTKFRIVRDLHAACPVCGRRYRFVEKERTLAESSGD
jgi:uncharacterized Zn-finger protein